MCSQLTVETWIWMGGVTEVVFYLFAQVVTTKENKKPKFLEASLLCMTVWC